MSGMARAVVAVLLGLAAMFAAMGWAARAMDAYQLGYEDGKRYMRNLLLGDNEQMKRYWEWRRKEGERDGDVADS